MSDLANNLLDAIASGNQESMSNAFADAMNSKINDSLQAKRIDIAQRIYSNAVEASSDINDADDSTEMEIASDGTEEA